MAHRFEIAQDLEVDASPEQIWDAIATGRGMDSWFMGRNEVEPREGGTALWSIGDYTAESTVTAWDPPRRFSFRQNEAPDGSFHQFDYRIEPQAGSRTDIKFAHTGMLGDDWEAEYEAMSEGDPMYFHKLVQYLTYFRGRYATGIDVQGPSVSDREQVMASYLRGLGLPQSLAEGDPVRVSPQGLDPIDGVLDYRSPHFIGIRTDDALYRFIHGFDGTTMVGHHLFADGVDREAEELRWRSWLNGLFGGAGGSPADAGV